MNLSNNFFIEIKSAIPLENILSVIFNRLVGCRLESNCPLVGPGTVSGVPSVAVFLRDPSLYLREL